MLKTTAQAQNIFFLIKFFLVYMASYSFKKNWGAPLDYAVKALDLFLKDLKFECNELFNRHVSRALSKTRRVASSQTILAICNAW
jgi:hypothetical protein